MTIENIDLSDNAGVPTGLIRVAGEDALNARFVSTGGSAPSTAVLEYYTHRTADEPGLFGGTVALTGAAVKIAVSTAAYISFGVTTTEGAKRGNLHIFARKTQE